MTTKLQELIDKRVKLVKDAGEFLTKCEDESGGLTKEQDAKFTKMHSDADALKAQIDGLEAGQKAKAERALMQAKAEEELAKAQSENVLPPEDLKRFEAQVKRPDTVMSIGQATEKVVAAWCSGGQRALEKPDIQAAMKISGCGIDHGDDDQPGGLRVMMSLRAPRTVADIVAAQSAGVGTEGGTTVPEGFLPNLEAAKLKYGGVRELATIIRTSRGNDLPMPNYNDATNKGAIIGENVQDGEQDIVFSSTILKAWLYTSKIIRVSKVLEQDSAFNMGSEIGIACGTRLGRIQNEHATTGDGANKPLGYANSSTLGVTAAGGNVVTYDEIMDLKHSVDPSYREGGMGSFTFNDAMLLAIKKIKDADGQPLFRPGMSAGVPDTIDGDRYAINQDMAAPAAGAISMTYGDHSCIYVREALGVTLVRMVERYADFHQVGYVAIGRCDSRIRNAGTNPIKHLIQG